jgi:hypothetical protein
MLPELTLPVSLAVLLGALQPCFARRRSFVTFCALAAGLAGQVRRRTVCGMLPGAGLGGTWPHDRAHRFFARARWDIDELGIAVARLAVMLLVPAGEPVTVAVDDSVFRRSGRRVHGALWQHDGSSPSQNRLTFGNCFVTCGIVVTLPFCTRPVCLPVLARLNIPAPALRRRKHYTKPGSKTTQACELVTRLAAAFPARRFHVVADAAYHGRPVRDLPGDVTWTCRLIKSAVLYAPAPPKVPGKPGRPRLKGPRLGTWPGLAAAADWIPATVRIYGRTQHIQLTAAGCLWYGCLHTREIRVIIARDPAGDTALATTDLTTPPERVIERYAARWSIEQAFHDARHILGAGEARNRVRPAVERTVPFTLLTCTLIIIWYARHGHDPADITARRNTQPWYTTKTEPCFEDMIIKLRRTLITARISGTTRTPPDPAQIQAVLTAWHAAAA